MKVHVKYHVTKLNFPIECYRYNVQIFRSIDGNNYYYCGDGKYCKNIMEVQNFINQYRKEN